MRVRNITNKGGNKLIGKFPSVKLGRIVWYESPLERDFLYLLEIDPDVISYQEQPGRIYYSLGGKKRRYTPDLLVRRSRKKQIIEVKIKKRAEQEQYARLFRIAQRACEKEGCEFKVVTEESIRLQPRLDNAKLLYKYARTPVRAQHQIVCHEFFVGREEASLGEVIQFFASRNTGQQVAYALIYRGILSVDLMQPFTRSCVVRLPIPALAERKAS